jgi:hypothetical protein
MLAHIQQSDEGDTGSDGLENHLPQPTKVHVRGRKFKLMLNKNAMS